MASVNGLAFKAPSLPYHSVVWKILRPDSVKCVAWTTTTTSSPKELTRMGHSKLQRIKPTLNRPARGIVRLGAGCGFRLSSPLWAAIGRPAAAPAQGAVRSVHGDWQIRCDTPPGAQSEQCALIQSVVAEDRPNVGLTVIVLKTADQKSRLMRVLAPLGVLLPSGLGLKVDNSRCRPRRLRALSAERLRCRSRDGRQAGHPAATGTTATFIIFQTPEEGIGFPLSLKGFGEGYDKLP